MFLILPYFLQVAIRWYFIAGASMPVVFPDEIGYWGNARYLSGTAGLPNMLGHNYYHFGYSLFVAPIFWFSDDPAQTYRYVLIWNCALLSTLYPALYLLLRRAFAAERPAACAIAFVTCLFPSFLLNPSVAWAENAFIPVFAWMLLAFHTFAGTGRLRHALTFSVLIVLLYAIHPRAVGLLPAAVLALIALGTLRIAGWSVVLTSLGLVAVGLLAVKRLDSHLLHLGYHAYSVTSGGALQQLRHKLGPEAIITGIGHMTYLAVTTYGLAIAGALALVHRVILGWKTNEQRHPDFLLAAFALVAAAGIAAVAAIFLALGLRADHVLYGRYNEGWLAFFLAVGLFQWTRLSPDRSTERTLLVGTAILGAALVTVTWLLEGERRLAGSSSDIHWLAIIGHWRLFHRDHFLAIGLAATLLPVLFLRPRFARKIALIGLAAAFVTSAALARRVVRHPRENVQPTWIAFLRSHPEIRELSFDSSTGNTRPILTTQFLLPHLHVHTYLSRFGQSPTTDFFIAGDTTDRRDTERAELVVDGKSNLSLFHRTQPSQ